MTYVFGLFDNFYHGVTACGGRKFCSEFFTQLFEHFCAYLRLHQKLGLSSTSDVITFDQNWHHLYSTFAGGKVLFNDTKIRVIGLMEPEAYPPVEGESR